MDWRNHRLTVRLQWTKEPPKEVVVSVNQELKVDCLAQGEPKPSMRWERLDSSASSFAAATQNRRANGVYFPSAAAAAAAVAGEQPVGMAKNQLAGASKCLTTIIKIMDCRRAADRWPT